MKIRPARRINGRVCLPGDKSISHRAVIIAALARGASRITNFATSADCAATVSCLRTLGVSIAREVKEKGKREGVNLRVAGPGLFGLSPTDEKLDCGNSGSTIRMLAGVLAGQNFTTTLTGDRSLRSRPMERIIEPLQIMGAAVSSQHGKPPLTIAGTGHLKSIKYELPVASAQVKSCLLFAGLHAAGRTEISEPLGATRDHTERLLKWFGVKLESPETEPNRLATIAVDGPVSLSACDVSIPGDVSSAAFLIAAAALLPDSNLEIEAVGLNPTRTRFLSTLSSLGFDLDITAKHEECNEPLGNVRVSGGLSSGQAPGAGQVRGPFRGPLIGQLIDELPLLAVVGTQISGGIEIRDAGELRHKESDRISATVKNLRAMGAAVDEFEDGLTVAGPTPLRGANIDACGDHRIAMAFTIAALIAEGDSEIADAECVGVSFPEFFNLLESIVER